MNGREELISAMKRIQGKRSAADMAAYIGITLTMLNYIYAGSRKPGVRVLRALLRAYPEMEMVVLDYILYGESPSPKRVGR